MPISLHISHARQRAVPRTKRDRPAARDIPVDDRHSDPASHDEVCYKRKFPFSYAKATEQQSFIMNVYTTEDPASIYKHGLGGERSRPRWTPEDSIVVLHGLRSDPKIKASNSVSGDMEPDTSWTIEAVDSETSGKEDAQVLNDQPQYRALGARPAVIDESDREEILYPRNLGATPPKPQGDLSITSSYDTPKMPRTLERPLMPENSHSSTSSPSSFSQRKRNPRNRPSGESELAQTGARSILPKRAGPISSTVNTAKDDSTPIRKHHSPHVNTPSPRSSKGKERHLESAGLTTNPSKSPPFPGKTPERHATQTSRSSSFSNVGDGYPSRRVHTTDLSHLPSSPSPSTQHPPRNTAQAPSSHGSSPHNSKTNSPLNMAHSPLRSGAAQEGWSSLDDVATAEALRKLDRRAGQRARARVHSFGRPSTASSGADTPAGRTSDAVDTSDSGKSKRGGSGGGGGGGGGLKETPLRPLLKSTFREPQISVLSLSQGALGSMLATDSSVKTSMQVGNATKTLDRAAHSKHPGTALSASANPPVPIVCGLPSSVQSSPQSMQGSPAGVSASQNTLSKNEMRSPAGSSTHNRSASLDLVPPAKPTFSSKIVRTAKHHRSSSAPLSVRYGNGNANETLGSRQAPSSPHASPTSTSTTSPYPISASFLPGVRRGYWNRRGDHLTPDGFIVYAPPALAYPAELAAYPPEEEGYQNEEGAFLEYAERLELSASLPWKGRAPERPYESFVVYVDDDSKGSLAPHWSSIDPFPGGRTPPKQNNKRSSHKKSPITATTKPDPKDEAGSPPKDPPRPVDPWDLDTRLAAFNSRRPISPTSSSSSYGSAHSTRSRASSFSGSAGGHIPGTSRDVMEFPFGYPIAN